MNEHGCCSPVILHKVRQNEGTLPLHCASGSQVTACSVLQVLRRVSHPFPLSLFTITNRIEDRKRKSALLFNFFPLYTSIVCFVPIDNFVFFSLHLPLTATSRHRLTSFPRGSAAAIMDRQLLPRKPSKRTSPVPMEDEQIRPRKHPVKSNSAPIEGRQLRSSKSLTKKVSGPSADKNTDGDSSARNPQLPVVGCPHGNFNRQRGQRAVLHGLVSAIPLRPANPAVGGQG